MCCWMHNGLHSSLRATSIAHCIGITAIGTSVSTLVIHIVTTSTSADLHSTQHIAEVMLGIYTDITVTTIAVATTFVLQDVLTSEC